MTYTVFSDFDGTIAVNDIGDAMFQKFGDHDICSKSFHDYRNGTIDARDCWRRGFSTMPTVTKEAFTDFAMQQPADQYFRVFVEFCERHQIPVTVLSDGYDAYIDPVLKRELLERLTRFTNKIQFHRDGTVEPQFPYTDAECSRCANCKRNHVLTRSGDDQVIVYIGDGISDRCPVQYADVVFAKDSLVTYCETQNITFHRFENFSDILKIFQPMVERSKPRKRRTAELARNSVFMGE
ncbi:MAG: MtnX-like HAD-IB family phosphatase [Bacteriovoracaceae bacterium]|nr:MtnX-like HAD-IB family phosphatase [Bacteroidota bacterium]